ncbi:Mu transposase domain-containing protein [Escherichia coli]
MNNRPMKGYGNQTRAERFRILDAPALSPLPLAPYEYTEYKAVKVGPDYHVEYARHWYSVPHELVGQRREIVRIPITVKNRGVDTGTSTEFTTTGRAAFFFRPDNPGFTGK